MAKQILDDILKAEQESEDIRLKAQSDVRDMVKASEEAIKSMEREARKEFQALYTSEMEARRQKIEADILQKKDAFQTEREQIMREARARISDAAALIAGKVTGNGHR